MRGRTHRQGRDPELEFVISQGSSMGVDLEHRTHLAINRSTSVDISKYHAYETSHASEGVNLLNEHERINPRRR
jgi:hypothetical protein